MPDSEEDKAIKRAIKEVQARQSDGKTDEEIAAEIGLPESVIRDLGNQKD